MSASYGVVYYREFVGHHVISLIEDGQSRCAFIHVYQISHGENVALHTYVQ